MPILNYLNLVLSAVNHSNLDYIYGYTQFNILHRRSTIFLTNKHIHPTTIRFYVFSIPINDWVNAEKGKQKSQGNCNHQNISHFIFPIHITNKIRPKTNKIYILSKFYSVNSANLQKFLYTCIQQLHSTLSNLKILM